MAAEPVPPALRERRDDLPLPPEPRAAGVPDPRGAAAAGRHRLCRHGPSLRRCRRDRHDGLHLLVLGDRPRERLRRRRPRRAGVPRPLPRRRAQGRLGRRDRREPGRDLSRPRCRPSGAARPHRARRRREDQRGAVVQRPAGLHPDHRHRAAGRDHPAAQRLRRCDRHRAPRPGRRGVEVHGRRHPRDLRCRARRRRLRRRARRRDGCEGARRRVEPAAQGGRPAGHPLLSRPACRRGVLRQHRQHRPARLHRGRPGRQRGQPDRCHVPLARSGGPAVLGLCRGGGRGPRAAGLGRSLRAARRAAPAGPLHHSIRRCRHELSGGGPPALRAASQGADRRVAGVGARGAGALLVRHPRQDPQPLRSGHRREPRLAGARGGGLLRAARAAAGWSRPCARASR